MKTNINAMKRRVKIIESVSIFLYVLGFLIVIITLVLDDKYPTSNWLLIGTLGFVFVNGTGLFLRNLIKTDKLEVEIKEKRIIYQNTKISEFTTVERNSVVKTLEELKFSYLSNNYYFKKHRSKNLSLYAKFTKFPCLENFLAKEIVRFKKLYERKTDNICGLLFVEMEKVTIEDLEMVTQVSKDFLLMEAAKINYIPLAVVIILTDISTNKTYFLKSPNPKDINIYTLGSLVLNKIYKNENKQ